MYETEIRWGRILIVILLSAIGLTAAISVVALVLRVDPPAWNRAVTDLASAGAAIGWAIAGALFLVGLAVFILALAYAFRHVEDGRRQTLTLTRTVEHAPANGLPGQRATWTATLASPAGWPITVERADGESWPTFRQRVEAQAQRPGWMLLDAPWQYSQKGNLP